MAGFVQLPQISGNGYYSYGEGFTDRQYGTEALIKTILDVGKEWMWNSAYEFGVGDMSFKKGGHMAPHHTHTNGKQVDIRPVRTDQLPKPVTFRDRVYDRELTRLLITTFLFHENVKLIYFNDDQIQGVRPMAGHDNHFHVQTFK